MIDAKPLFLGRAALAAAAVAALAAALVFAIALSEAADVELTLTVLAVGFLLGLMHFGLIGLQLYLALAQRYRLRWWSAMLGGFVTGAVPMPLLLSPHSSLNSRAPEILRSGLSCCFLRRSPEAAVRWVDWRSSRF